MKKALAAVGSALSYLTLTGTAFAQAIGVGKPESAEITDVGKLVSNSINVVLIVAGILIFVYLVWGGLQWMTSGGDKSNVEQARNRITHALIGLAIVAAAWALTLVISNFLGTGAGLQDGFTLPTAFD
jgi:hypothetical protein